MSLTNISPIDGRYQEDTKELIPYFSEFALIRYRVFIEVEYLLSLSQIIKNLKLDETATKNLKNIYFNFEIIDEDTIENSKLDISITIVSKTKNPIFRNVKNIKSIISVCSCYDGAVE